MQNLYHEIKNQLHFNKFVKEDLLCVEYSCPLTDEEVGIWSQMDYVIHVLSGKKSWKTLEGTFEVNAGDTVYIKKGAAFIRQFFDDDFCMLAFFLSDDLIREAVSESKNELHSNYSNAEFDIFDIQESDLLNSYFQGMLHHFQDMSKPMDTLLELKFKELVINLILGNANASLKSYFLEVANHSTPSLAYTMERNYSFDLSLEELARLSHRSLSSFKRDFNKQFGTTPGKWILAKRLERACALLNDESLNVAQVAYQSGFKDNSHFGRSFKEKYGVTPIEFRNNLKKA